MIKKLLFLLVLAYVVVVLSLYVLQRKMMYFPRVAPEYTHYEVLDIESGELIIKVIREGSHLDQAVIYFGGNGEDIYAGAERLKTAFADRTAYYVNYPGYGGSTGSPTEGTITQSAKDVYEFVSAMHSGVAVVGRSLGTGVAVKLASEYTVSHLVLISPYDSIANVASNYYPFFPRSLIKDKFDSLSLASKVNAKTLVLMARDDNIIPIANSLRLLEALKKTQVISMMFDRADHNNLHLKTGFMMMIRYFLRNQKDDRLYASKSNAYSLTVKNIKLCAILRGNNI